MTLELESRSRDVRTVHRALLTPRTCNALTRRHRKFLDARGGNQLSFEPFAEGERQRLGGRRFQGVPGDVNIPYYKYLIPLPLSIRTKGEGGKGDKTDR